MGWAAGLTVYIVVWWLVVFMVLPWGVQPVDAADVERGHAAGAPKRPRLVLKMAVTTVIATIIWVVIYLIIDSGVITFRE